MHGIESSIYFMLAMMFVGMPAAVIGGIAWECRKRTKQADDAASEEPSNDAQPEDSESSAEFDVRKPR